MKCGCSVSYMAHKNGHHVESLADRADVFGVERNDWGEQSVVDQRRAAAALQVSRPCLALA